MDNHSSSNIALLENNVDHYIIMLIERLEVLRKNSHHGVGGSNYFLMKLQGKRSMRVELHSLNFWRSIICEGLASFFYVFIVSGAAAGAGVGASVSSVLLATSLASGFTMATLTHCFLRISGAHINPAVTLASCVIGVISPIRAAMYVTAQCSGGIAGAALLYSISVPGYQGNLNAADAQSAFLANWERFGIEFILTFVVVLSYFVSTTSLKNVMGDSAVSIGVAYSACNFVLMPHLNPARTFGPAFVLNRWEHHWVHWFGPVIGGVCSGIIYQYIFNPKSRYDKASSGNDLSSIRSEDFNSDFHIDKLNARNNYSDSMQRNGRLNVNMQNLYSAQPHMGKFQSHEPVYDGVQSMYSGAPTLPRANLSRSQSVYTKSNVPFNCETSLIPVHSSYPVQTFETKTLNKSVKCRIQQCDETYSSLRGKQKQNHQPQNQKNHKHQQLTNEKQNEQHAASIQQSSQEGHQTVLTTSHMCTPNEFANKYERRADVIYGLTAQRVRGHSTQSDDSSYGSYLSSAITPLERMTANDNFLTHTSSQRTPDGHTVDSPIYRQAERNETTPVANAKYARYQPQSCIRGENTNRSNQKKSANI